MKKLILLFLTCAAVLGQSRPMYYDNATRNVAPTDLDYVGATANFTASLQLNGVNVVTTARTITAGAGTSGGGDLSANRTITWAPDTFVNNLTFWDGANATRTITFNLSAGDPVLSLGNGVFNISSGTLQYGGNTVATAANNLSFFSATTSAQLFGIISDAVGSSGFAIRVAGTASNGFVPISNGAGVITWGAQSGGGGSAPVGTMVNVGNNITGGIPIAADATDTNYVPSSVTVSGGTNLNAGTVRGTNAVYGGQFIGTGATGDSIVAIPDGDGSTYFSLTANPTTTTAVNFQGPAAPFAGLAKFSIGDSTNWIPAVAVEGTDYASPVSTNTFTNKTFDAGGTGNVLRQTKQLNLQRPDYGDGIGAVPQTNNYTASGLMHYTLSGNAETNGNYIVYEFDCPSDLDTSVEMTARFAFLSGGTDADDYVFHLTYGQVAPGTAYPTGTSISSLPIVMTVTPTTAANGDLQSSGAVTLTGWAAALTPGRAMLLRIARLQNSQDDGARDVQLVISYGSTL